MYVCFLGFLFFFYIDRRLKAKRVFKRHLSEMRYYSVERLGTSVCVKLVYQDWLREQSAKDFCSVRPENRPPLNTRMTPLGCFSPNSVYKKSFILNATEKNIQLKRVLLGWGLFLVFNCCHIPVVREYSTLHTSLYMSYLCNTYFLLFIFVFV